MTEEKKNVSFFATFTAFNKHDLGLCGLNGSSVLYKSILLLYFLQLYHLSPRGFITQMY